MAPQHTHQGHSRARSAKPGCSETQRGEAHSGLKKQGCQPGQRKGPCGVVGGAAEVPGRAVTWEGGCSSGGRGAGGPERTGHPAALGNTLTSGWKGGSNMWASSRLKLMSLNTGCPLTSAAPSPLQPRRCLGSLVSNCGGA